MVSRAIEFLLLFFAAPTVFAYTRHKVPAIPALWAVLAYCLFIMLRDSTFQTVRFWNTTPLRQYGLSILILFLIVLGVGVALVLRYTPETFLSLPRTNPSLWIVIMLLYPVLSAYPQGIIYRAFIFGRYSNLFGSGLAMVLVSAAAFSYVHIVMGNRLAVILTFPAGLLFAFRYLETGSLFVSSFEHALYGCAVFTIGLGRWFYHSTKT